MKLLVIPKYGDEHAPSAPTPLRKKLDYVIAIPVFLFALGPLLLWECLRFMLGRAPVASWPLKRLLFHRTIYLFINIFLGRQLPIPATYQTEIAIPKHNHNPRGVTAVSLDVEPVTPADRIGFAKLQAVKAVVRPGFMLSPETSKAQGLSPALPGERVIMYIVGGAFITGHPLKTSFAKSTCLGTGLRVFSINYRKALNGSSAFPAPLLDVFAGYKYLVRSLGFQPENVIIMGESAGANLTLALCRYLAELRLAGHDYGMPQTLLLNSPWADLTSSMRSCIDNKPSDYVGGLGRLAVPSYIRHFPGSIRHPYFSPALATADELHHLRGTKVYIQVGTKELLYDEGVALHRNLSKGDVQCRLREDIDGTHCNAVLGYQEALQTWIKDVKEVLGVE